MQIGKRQSIDDLRKIWPRETDFSDWLVTESGLQLIAEDIGVQVENPVREAKPGDYPCDIVGNMVGDENHVVIIENQFGKTNHDHLGKLLTYASANAATTAIWLSEKVSDDHRKVIDWLNDITPHSISFYLAQVKAYRIDSSPIAPSLDVVCRPNLEVKLQKETSSELKTIQIWRKDFWGEILSFIKSKNPPFNLQSPSVDHWSAISVGHSNFNLALLLLPGKQKVGIELVGTPSWKEAAFEQLSAQKLEIEREIGISLQWQSLPHLKRLRIFLEADIDPKIPENKQAILNWMNQYSVAFYQAFKPRIARLTPHLNHINGDETEES